MTHKARALAIKQIEYLIYKHELVFLLDESWPRCWLIEVGLRPAWSKNSADNVVDLVRYNHERRVSPDSSQD